MSNQTWMDGLVGEKSDNRWQAGLRAQQTWWRETVLDQQPAGPISKGKPSRLVSSMLPLDASLDVNLMTPEAVAAYRTAKDQLNGRPGMIQEDRLTRNLLSSQPLCFNLFGYLSHHRKALLPWLRNLDSAAASVEAVHLEWAPHDGNVGRSAFDAFVVYVTESGSQRFIGIECKYAEDLAKAHPKPAAEKWFEMTGYRWWRDGAAKRLDQPKLRQFWFNQILGQVVAASENFEQGTVVVVACDADSAAREVCGLVANELADPSQLRFQSIEHIVSTIDGHDRWKRAFTERYTDFAPIQGVLPLDDPRRI